MSTLLLGSASPGFEVLRTAGVSRKPNWISQRVKEEAKTIGLVFVCEPFLGSAGEVKSFSKKDLSTPIGTITNGTSIPVGLALDTSENLYVTNVGNNTMTAYAPPYTGGPTSIYSSTLNGPTFVAVGSDGTVYVASAQNQQVVEYPPGSTQTSITIPFLKSYPQGLVLRPNNHLYVAFDQNLAGPGDIARFAPGATTGKDLGIKTLGFARGLSVDAAHNLVVVDETAPAIDVFPPGASTPSQKIDNGLFHPYGIAFDRPRKTLYVTDDGPSSGNGDVQIIAYPSGNTIKTVGGFDHPLGIAVSPQPPQ